MSALALFYMAVTPLLAKRYSAKGRYYAWLIIVIGLIIPFRPQFDNPFVKITPTETATPIIQVGNGTQLIGPVENALPPSVTSHISLSWWQIAAAVWLVGIIAFLAYHTVKHYRFMKMTRRWCETITDEQTLSLFQNLKAEVGISKQIDLYQCLSIGTPMLIGFSKPKILLPNTNFAKDDLRFILNHELVHYKRKDLWYRCLVLSAKAIHWFNPLMYLMARAIDTLCEISCDTEVVRSTNADMRQQYSETIIGIVKYQSKMKTALSTNFYGGKNGMKKRIFSIMDTGKKRTGAVVLCAALLLTLGTGAAFAVNAAAESTPENISITNVAYGDGNQGSTPANWEPLPGYEAFGISYDANNKMLFNGQLVRYFWDGYEIEPGMTVTHYDYLNEDGVVDVHTIRSVIEIDGGGIDQFGELTDIVAYSQQQFDERDIEWLKGAGSGPVATSVDGGGENTGGRTFAEIFLAYKDYGIEYVPTPGGLGNVYYQGQLVKTFIDENNNGGVFMLQSIDGGDITVRTVYDASGNLSGVKVDD